MKNEPKLEENFKIYKNQKLFVWQRRYNYVSLMTIMLLYVIFMHIPVFVKAERKEFKVHWNSSNPIFRIDNTDNVFDINKGNAPWEHDQVHILCPYYDSNAQNGPNVEIEKYVIYNVNKEEFDTCRLQTSMPRY